jgi:hypothetical protein
MNLAEIKEAVKKDPALAGQIAVWTTSETDAGKELLTNFAKAEVEKAVKENTAEIYTNIDNDLFEKLGVRKKNDEKTYDFLKGIAGDYKALKDKAGALDNDAVIKQLKADIKKMQDEGSVNEHWKKIHDEAVVKWEAEKTELAGKITEKEKEFFEAQVEADLRAGLSGMTFKDGIDQDVIDTLVSAKKDKIVKGAKIVEGKVVYHKEDGTPILNKEYKPITPKEIWGEQLGTLIKSDAPAGGGGANPTLKGGKVVTTGEGDNATIKVVLDEGSFSTKVEFNNRVDEALRKQGIAVGTKEYNDATLNAYKEYDVDKLDLQ